MNKQRIGEIMLFFEVVYNVSPFRQQMVMQHL